MNVFYLDHDTQKCAEYHNDKHCVKMILEYAQLLSTAHRLIDGDDCNQLVYKSTHKNHPSSIWARENKSNYEWLYDLFWRLCNEYTHRYEKVHLSYKKLRLILAYPPKNMNGGDFTQPTPAMPDECKTPNDSLASYRFYYQTEKDHIAKWTKRDKPDWFVSQEIE